MYIQLKELITVTAWEAECCGDTTNHTRPHSDLHTHCDPHTHPHPHTDVLRNIAILHTTSTERNWTPANMPTEYMPLSTKEEVASEVHDSPVQLYSSGPKGDKHNGAPSRWPCRLVILSAISLLTVGMYVEWPPSP